MNRILFFILLVVFPAIVFSQQLPAGAVIDSARMKVLPDPTKDNATIWFYVYYYKSPNGAFGSHAEPIGDTLQAREYLTAVASQRMDQIAIANQIVVEEKALLREITLFDDEYKRTGGNSIYSNINEKFVQKYTKETDAWALVVNGKNTIGEFVKANNGIVRFTEGTRVDGVFTPKAGGVVIRVDVSQNALTFASVPGITGARILFVQKAGEPTIFLSKEVGPDQKNISLVNVGARRAAAQANAQNRN